MTVTFEQIVALPKVLLHDHLDGGVRPATVVDLAAEAGHELPTTDPGALATWFAERAEDWNAYARRVGRDLDDPAGWPLVG